MPVKFRWLNRIRLCLGYMPGQLLIDYFRSSTPREQTFRTDSQLDPTNILPANSTSPRGLPGIDENAGWNYHAFELGDHYIRTRQNGHDEDAWSSKATYGSVDSSCSTAATVRTRGWLRTQEPRSQDTPQINDHSKHTNREPRQPRQPHPNRPDTRRSPPIPPPKEPHKPEGHA